MKKLSVFLFLLVCIPAVSCFGQDNNGYLKIRAKVIEIPKSSFDDEDIKNLMENSYIFIIYKVLQICQGSYYKDEIKVAHGVTSRRKLKIGDEVTLKVKPFPDFREEAEVLREVGIIRSEESIADYISDGFTKSEPCF